MAKNQQREKPESRPAKGPAFELRVTVVEGPISEAFDKDNPEVSRTIQIRGTQTLDDLHEAIFKAFDRFDEHMYEFQLGGKGPMDPKAKRYVMPLAMEDSMDDSKPAGDVTRTAIGSLGLKVGQVFGYWFDFGDDWWHQVEVAAIVDPAPPGEYPRVTAKVGASPPQYPDLDDEDVDDEDDDEWDDEELDGEEPDGDEFGDDDDDEDFDDDEP